jgi:hypothetical protein
MKTRRTIRCCLSVGFVEAIRAVVALSLCGAGCIPVGCDL